MKATQAKRFGGPEVLEVVERPRPVPGKGEILVEVAASPVTQGDRRVAQADFPAIYWLPGRLVAGFRRPRHPDTGTMFAGRVAALGEGVTGFDKGDRVFGAANHGAHAEYMVVKAASPVIHTPDAVSDATAAALPYAAATALQFLRHVGKVQPGQKVLILGATGAVGAQAVQIARALGAEVTGAASAGRLEEVRGLGAHHAVDYRAAGYLTAHGPYDVIFDTARSVRFRDAEPALTPTGRLMYLDTAHRELWDVIRTSRSKGRKAIMAVVLPGKALLTEVAELAASGAIRPAIGARYPLARIAEAYGRLSQGGAGTVMIDIARAALVRAA